MSRLLKFDPTGRRSNSTEGIPTEGPTSVLFNVEDGSGLEQFNVLDGAGFVALEVIE